MIRTLKARYGKDDGVVGRREGAGVWKKDPRGSDVCCVRVLFLAGSIWKINQGKFVDQRRSEFCKGHSASWTEKSWEGSYQLNFFLLFFQRISQCSDLNTDSLC